MARSICIVCKEEKKGTEIEDDAYLETIRRIKQKLNIAANNKLVVCKECMPAAVEKRRRFERTLMTWGILATLMFVMFILMSPTLFSFLLAVVVVVFFMLFALLFSYFPKVESHGRKKD